MTYAEGDCVDKDSRDRYLGRIKSLMALGCIDFVAIGIHFHQKVIKCRVVLKNSHVSNPRVACFCRSFTRYIDVNCD
jgi:hypothetical protein